MKTLILSLSMASLMALPSFALDNGKCKKENCKPAECTAKEKKACKEKKCCNITDCKEIKQACGGSAEQEKK